MPNPWLQIPIAEYEGHMASPEVGQLRALAELFGEALAVCKPASVALAGVAGGNGLERIDSSVTRRVVGIDINPAYLETARVRYRDLAGLELVCADLAAGPLRLEPVHLVHAALILEHAGTGRCLDNVLALVKRGGELSVVLQLPSLAAQEVATTPYRCMQALKSDFSLVDPALLRAELRKRGFHVVQETHRPLPSGKAFWMGIFSQSSSRKSI